MQSLKKCKQNTYTNTHKEIVSSVCVCVCVRTGVAVRESCPIPMDLLVFVLGVYTSRPGQFVVFAVQRKKENVCLHDVYILETTSGQMRHELFIPFFFYIFFFFGFRASVSHDRREGITLKRLKRKAVVADTQNISHKPSPARE